MERTIRVRTPRISQIVHGNYWTVTLATHENGALGIRSRGTVRTFNGLYCAILPPFSVLEIHLAPGELRYQAVFLVKHYPSYLPLEAACFQPAPIPFPDSEKDLIHLIRSARSFEFIGLQENPSSAARRAKSYIDAHYRESFLLSQLGKVLGHRYETVSRAFKANFLLSPAKYRAKLRISEFMVRNLIYRDSIVEAAYEAGFNHLTNFYRQFHREMGGTPASYSAQTLKANPLPFRTAKKYTLVQ